MTIQKVERYACTVCGEEYESQGMAYWCYYRHSYEGIDLSEEDLGDTFIFHEQMSPHRQWQVIGKMLDDAGYKVMKQ